jgi:hypothetical protein
MSISMLQSSRVSGRNVDIAGRNGTSTSRGSNSVGKNLVTDFFQVAVGEDETNVAWAEVSYGPVQMLLREPYP